MSDPQKALPAGGAHALGPWVEPRAGLTGFAETEWSGAAPGQNGPARPIHLWAVLRWKWTIALTFGVVAGVALPLIWLFVKPTYTATAAVYVSSRIPRILYKTDENGIVPNYQQRLNTQAFTIRSSAVLDEVLDNADVRKTAWYQREERTLLGEPITRMERLRNGLSVTASGQSEVITVAFRALAAREAKTIADAVVKSFQGYRSRTFNEGDVQRMTELSAKYEEAQKEIKRILGQRSVVAHEAKTPDAQQLRLPLAKRREELLSERSTLDRQLQMEHWERRAFADAAEGGNAAASRPYHEDGEWRELHRALQNARHELEKARQQLGDSHPKIIERQSDEQHAQKLLDERQAQLDQYWESAVAQLNAPGDSSAAARQLPLELRISRDEQALKLLGQEIAALEEKIDWTEDRATQLTQFDEELRQQRELSDLVFTQMQALETESKAPLDIQIQLAPEPSRPDRDRRILFCIMALVAGLMTGVGLAYLRAIMDPTFRDLGDVRGTMQLPFLGQLPELPARSDVATEANPQLIESIRMVRTALLARFPDTTCRSVLVTSSSPQAGKSTFVVLLARSLASLGKRVLLVEADFHHPCLAERLQLESAAGLVMLLAGTVDDDRAIIHTAVPQLDVIPVGPPAPGIDTDTLANGQFAACLRRWRANYDFILLDSPPMRPVADARILSRHADGTIMLLRSSRCHKVEVIEAYADLSAAGGTLLGTVLVGGERRGGYYSYSYEYARQRGSNYLPKA